MLKHLSVFIIIITFTKISFCQVSFAAFQAYPNVSRPEVVCIGDVNNDGHNDVVLGTTGYTNPSTDFKIFVYLQNSSGNLSTPILYPYPHPNTPVEAIAIADVNNDNLNDVILGVGYHVIIFYQNNLGGLDTAQSVFSGVSVNKIDGISIGDFNHDGLKDITISHWGNTFITTMIQQPVGGFSFITYSAPQGGYDQIEAGDLNNDNLDDIALILGQGIGGFYLYNQNTFGSMNNYITYPNISGQQSNHGIAIGDLNNDGINDIVKSYGGNFATARIALYFQDAITHQFLSPLVLQAYDIPEPIRVADLNCDGRNEIIAAHGGWMKISVFEQDAANNYNTYTLFNVPYASHYNPYGLSIGDINNDNKKDIAIADYNNGLIILKNQSVLLGNCCIMPITPSKPIGDTLICSYNDAKTYKLQTPYNSNLSWHYFPAQAGSILSSTKDSCIISWNNLWHGMAYIYVSSSNSCGTVNSDTLNIFLNKVQQIKLGNDTTLCPSDTIILNAGNNYCTSYLWQNATTDSIYIAVSGGTYHVISSNACGISTDTINIQAVPLPIINLCNDTIICPGTSLILDVTLTGNNTYLWQDNSTNSIYTVTNSGTYTVKITDFNHCQNQKSVTIIDYFPPDVRFPTDTLLCIGTQITLNAFNNNSSYLWQNGSTYPQYILQDSGIYHVTVTNICGAVSDTVNVALEDCSSILNVPSAFTPDGDGINDVFLIPSNNITKFHILIYNRWGNLIFETYDIYKAWNGKYKDEPVPQDVYIYFIEAEGLDHEIYRKKGTITVLQ